MGIRTRLPILDRHNPLANSIAQYVHWDLAVHRGAETCSRVSMEQVSIMQGAALYREIGQNCPRCAIKRKRYRDLLVGDLVYFVKKDGALDNKWTMGMVEVLDKGRDGVIRKATIKYCNSGEQKLSLDKAKSQDDSTFPRYTERTVRKLVKIFSLEETSIADDMAELDRREKQLMGVRASQGVFARVVDDNEVVILTQ